MEKIKAWATANWYVLKDRIDWDWDRYKDGTPSVTTILQLLLEPSFEYVKRRYASEVQQACDRGTKIHLDAEYFFNGDSEQIHKQIMKFHVLYNVTIKDKEIHWHNCRHWFQWTIDLVCELDHLFYWESRRVMNIDYKSSMKESKKYFLQICWYKELNWNDWAILYLSDKKFKLVFVPPEYMELWIELRRYFFSLLKQWQYQFIWRTNFW